MMRAKRKPQDNGSPAWMNTYADMVTLLLVFFVLLFSFSAIDVQKFKAFVASFQGVGILDWGPSPLEEVLPPQTPDPTADDATKLPEPENIVPQESFRAVYRLVTEYLEANGLSDVVEVSYTDRGVALNIQERILFDSGKADLKAEAQKTLDTLADLFKTMPYQISVEGHTDPRPIHTVEFPTNWELSTTRAVRVVRYFTEEHGLDPVKFAAVGFGPFHPAVPNNSPENMALNRRVVLVINAKNIYETEDFAGD